MFVVRQFNVLMRQLDETHGEIIQKYASQYSTFGGSSTFGKVEGLTERDWLAVSRPAKLYIWDLMKRDIVVHIISRGKL